ncbi:hypothetical protein, partial [Xanthomonas oryzae]|uniref:hypothetical protein n=1 Tax=Xanthomonas oryzae TaxID=347 RepID=UPI001C67DB75
MHFSLFNVKNLTPEMMVVNTLLSSMVGWRSLFDQPRSRRKPSRRKAHSAHHRGESQAVKPFAAWCSPKISPTTQESCADESDLSQGLEQIA